MIRLVITEGPRFPQLAEIYYREVINRALAAVRGIVQQAIERGEIHGDALHRFPQLLVAPGLVAVLWEALFARFEPLDVAAMMRAHIDLVFAALETGVAMTRVRAGVALLLALALLGCNNPGPPTYQGWIEADLVFVGPDEAGRVDTLAVSEGVQVEAGAPLFTVDAELQKADLAVAQASATNARQALERAQTLLKSSAGTQKAYEDAEMLQRSAEARLASARTRLGRRSVFSPATGSIQQIYFRPGEVVPAGRPVVSLLPPGNVKVRFFVPEATLPNIALGAPVMIRCDGCAENIPARISFISRTSEFTPPVIYSQEERSKLVFLVEARTERTDSLRVGQPVSVVLAGQDAKK